MQYRNTFTAAALVATLICGMAGPTAAQGMMGGGGDDPAMMGPGAGMGPGMMQSGCGVMGGGMGPGRMGQGMMGPGMMGQGMMGQGRAGARRQMGSGRMAGGAGMGLVNTSYGHGLRVVARMNLTVDDVRNWFAAWLEAQGNKRLRVGKVTEKDKQTIAADVETVDGSLVQRLDVNRHTGLFEPADEK